MQLCPTFHISRPTWMKVGIEGPCAISFSSCKFHENRLGESYTFGGGGGGAGLILVIFLLLEFVCGGGGGGGA